MDGLLPQYPGQFGKCNFQEHRFRRQPVSPAGSGRDKPGHDRRRLAGNRAARRQVRQTSQDRQTKSGSAKRAKKPADDFSLSLLVSDALALLDLVGADRAHILGNSAGEYVSQQLAINQRGSAHSLSPMPRVPRSLPLCAARRLMLHHSQVLRAQDRCARRASAGEWRFRPGSAKAAPRRARPAQGSANPDNPHWS
jgi:pimeloyl-ACP methyl ester carboxylesterase